ncbi:carbonyl reductase [NADPH] 1 isoform X2 [Mustela lutreola]|uniref:carbonyl reductase [NADPH] 1 isoform X2 n=1 Tax=Mustela lutreola TaxID=9666 RepID=UPI0027977CC2|nr:carbonyl reductase [NADPH] 1 isoform X2 [Mustela lutreola]
MSSCSRVALVTGANKGIGFAIVRDLCRQFSGDVVLTARDEARGRAAVQQLQAEGLSPRFHLLDIDDLQSIRALRDFLRREYGGLDVLVNNAGIAFKTNDPTPFHIQAEVTMKTNFFGTRDVCTELLPLMKPQGCPHRACPAWVQDPSPWPAEGLHTHMCRANDGHRPEVRLHADGTSVILDASCSRNHCSCLYPHSSPSPLSLPPDSPSPFTFQRDFKFSLCTGPDDLQRH